MPLDQINDPFAEGPFGSGGVPDPVDKEVIRTPLNRKEVIGLSPGTHGEKVKDIVDATEDHEWTETSGIGMNEKVLFDNQYRQVARRYFMEAGDVAVKTFADFYPIALGATLNIVKEQRRGSFKGERAEGNEQFLVRPIVPDTLGEAETNLETRPGGTGAVDDFRGTVQPSTNKNNDEQEFLIFGYIMTTDPSVIVSAHDDIDDPLGLRPEVGIHDTAGMSDANFIPKESVTYVQNRDTYSLDIVAAKDELCDLMPAGIDIITANQSGPQ